ncbi:MAG: Trk system potassium transporter TrkA [Candidatus Omnitrophica bacterium]|nr:Trk system potassium transporter TrkA [Candidatus Omnitrophota bacterium]MBU1997645.1 Trk system potassium transporter TrkA [Candidatus Omnitrophota bacterium]MBU4334354.1 Trk system potassium transporter TrkA [Candidatus Omnitrophota bacterium]
MRIIIIGAGRIGLNLAKSLVKENHEVYIIEANEDIARKVDEKLDAKVVFGSGADPDTLRKVQVQSADLVIAVTHSDETNMIVCSLADFFGAKRQVARVRNTALSRELGASGFEHFNIDEIINPEEVAAHAIVKAICSPGTREVGDFAEGSILLRGFDLPAKSPLAGSKISDFNDDDFPWPFLVVAISREKEAFIPTGETVLNPKDRIYVLLPRESLGEFLSFVDPTAKKPEKVIIYGATDTGVHVAQELSKTIRDVILLEEDPKRAENVAEKLEFTRVINGSASDKDILTECGIEAADVFVGATDNDNSNLISAVLAKKRGAKTTVIMTQHPDYMSIVDALDINVIVNPHLLAVEQILSYVRGKTISSITKLLDCKAEALEFIVEKNSPITKVPVKDAAFPKNSIIGAVFRDSKAFLAKGDTQIQEGDKVVVFCKETEVKKVQSFFIQKKGF